MINVLITHQSQVVKAGKSASLLSCGQASLMEMCDIKTAHSNTRPRDVNSTLTLLRGCWMVVLCVRDKLTLQLI